MGDHAMKDHAMIALTPTRGRARAAAKAAALALAAFLSVVSAAQETTIEVPQGSPVFPSIAQVDCLEEVASGSLCAATWECADGSSGELWGDMGNPDGRRTTSAGHDVAIKRGCVVTVDGRAAVRWFSGFRPAGRTGDLLGVTTMAAAKRPVVRTTASATGSDGLLLDWLIDEHGYDVQDMLDRECVHIRDEATEHRRECEYGLRSLIGEVSGIASTEFTRCVAGLAIEWGEQTRSDKLPEEQALGDTAQLLRDAYETFGLCDGDWYELEEKRGECCALFRPAAERFGLTD